MPTGSPPLAQRQFPERLSQPVGSSEVRIEEVWGTEPCTNIPVPRWRSRCWRYSPRARQNPTNRRRQRSPNPRNPSSTPDVLPSRGYTSRLAAGLRMRNLTVSIQRRPATETATTANGRYGVAASLRRADVRKNLIHG